MEQQVLAWITQYGYLAFSDYSSMCLNGGAKIDHETPTKRWFVAVQK